MENNERQTTRARLVTMMLAGQSWQQAAAATAMPVKRAMAYRLVRVVRIRGEAALQDGRHDHPSKLRGEARTWVETYCRDTPQTPSWQVQAALDEFEQAGVMSSSPRRELKAQKAAADAELEALRDLEGRAYMACNQEFAKCARYCHQQRVVLRQLEDLNAKERKMVEPDNRKDQIMTVLRVALSNVGMLVRDQYFPLFMLDLSQKLRSRGVEVTRSKRQK